MSISNDIVTWSPGVNHENFMKVLTSPQFNHWRDKQDPAFIYHSVNVDAITMFGPNPGLIHITTDITFNGIRCKRVVFIRGDSVAVLLKIKSKLNGNTYVVYVRQPRVSVGVRELIEIPAGMLDGVTGTLNANGVAIKEIKEETGIDIQKDDLVLLGSGFPSAGGCDELISLYEVNLLADDSFIQELIEKKTGEIGSHEQITVGIAEYEDFKTMLVDGRCRDFKAMSAIMLSETMKFRNQTRSPRDITPTVGENPVMIKKNNIFETILPNSHTYIFYDLLFFHPFQYNKNRNA